MTTFQPPDSVFSFADISQRALTKKNVFHMLRSHLQAKNSSATPTSAFLLLTICADNSKKFSH